MYRLDIKLILRNLNMSRDLIMVLQASTKGQNIESKSSVDYQSLKLNLQNNLKKDFFKEPVSY